MFIIKFFTNLFFNTINAAGTHVNRIVQMFQPKMAVARQKPSQMFDPADAPTEIVPISIRHLPNQPAPIKGWFEGGKHRFVSFTRDGLTTFKVLGKPNKNNVARIRRFGNGNAPVEKRTLVLH